MSLLSVKNLNVSFVRDKIVSPAVKNISFEVQEGETLAVVGESGSGKSVTALSILQLISDRKKTVFSGSIYIKTKNGISAELTGYSAAQMQQIRGSEVAMIFQEPMTSLNPVVKCGRQVVEAITAHQKTTLSNARKRTLELFKEVQLPDPSRVFNSYPHQLSGGQKQRVMIAMAMSCNPVLLICDEPTTALDVTVQKAILQLIKDLQRKNNMAVIFISHDLAVVSEIADNIMVMYNGEIVEKGPASSIYHSPTHPYTRALLACRPSRYKKGERLPVVADILEGHTYKNLPFISSPVDEVIPSQALVPVLSLKNVKVWFETNRKLFGEKKYIKAVDGISLSVAKGETVGLVGESGCGKSTLGRTILQLIKPTSGEIVFEGKDLSLANASELKRLRTRMQIIFQDPYSSLNPRMTIGEAIAEPIQVHKLAPTSRQKKERVEELLKKVGLQPSHYNRYPHEFSGGQRQRIVIARALALKPSFVICDESVSALDVSIQAQILNLLNELKTEFHFSSIFISHDLSVIKYISDRVIVMNKGKIEESGTPHEIYNHPKSAYTQKLIESLPKGWPIQSY